MQKSLGTLLAPKVRKQLVSAYLSLSVLIVTALPVAASSGATDSGGVNVWTKASEIMKDVYTNIVSISTVAGIVTASVALLMMNFSKSGKTVDEARAWLKRIIITWAIINGLGFIMAYITPFLQGGTWNG